MTNKIYIAIDNGTSGTIGLIYPDSTYYFDFVPVFSQQSYTKTKQNITRIDVKKLMTILEERLTISNDIFSDNNCLVLIERPMINPMRFKASISAARALESTLLCVEHFELPYQYEDSKAWQKELLPAGLKDVELKKASLDIGNRLFPAYKNNKHPDRDSLLMAEYARRKNL